MRSGRPCRAAHVVIEPASPAHSRDEHGHVRGVPRAWQFRDELGRHRLALPCALDVDQRALPRHEHGLFDLTDPQLGIDGGGEARRQRDTFALDGTESGKRERHRVRPRVEIDDLVDALAVGDGRSHLFNQRRTRGFNRDARKHRAACILHDPADDTSGLTLSR